MNDELLVEVGVYAGEGGLGEDGGWDPRATEGGASEPRRVMARRYDRGGRFASAFFVEESRMTSAESRLERDEGERAESAHVLVPSPSASGPIGGKDEGSKENASWSSRRDANEGDGAIEPKSA